jgi:FkbH-like protein
MTQKTNQFNLTTRRYTQEDIGRFIKEGAYAFCAGVKDKFGDNGITIAGIIQPINEEAAYIDSYLMSCRLLGREIEIAVVWYMFNLLHQKGVRHIKAKYIPTKKNILAADFYDKAGFTLDHTEADGTKHYSLLLNDYFNIKDYYKINAHGAYNKRDYGIGV